MLLLINLLVAGALFSTGNCDSCEGNRSCDYLQSDIRRKLFQSLENALIQDENNIYRLRKVFFYAPNVDPVLLRVYYSVTFSENITDDVLLNCTDPTCAKEDSALNLNQSDIIRGWTSRGLYQLIEPLALSRIQMALPFDILRWIHSLQIIRVNVHGDPEMASFLWDGSEDYPLDSLCFNLHITSLPCIPSQKTFNSTVEELTTYLKVYASLEYVSDTFHTSEDIGYVLSENETSTLPTSSNVMVYLIVYDTVGFVLALLSCPICTGAAIKIKATQSQPVSYHENISLSIVLLGGTWMIFKLVETLRHNIRDNPLLIFVWIYGALICIPILLAPVCLFVKRCCIRRPIKLKKAGEVMYAYLRIAMYLIIPYLIYHYALSTFLLLLIHPMKVIITFAYLVTATFIAIIVCSAYVTVFKNLNTYVKLNYNITFQCRYFCLSLVALIYIIIVIFTIGYLLFLYILAYAVMLNQSSPIATGPIYTILALIPTVAVSFITWTLKNKIFDSISIEELKNAVRAEDTTEQRDTNDLNANIEEEHLPLLTVEGNNSASETAPRSESSPNLRNRQNYGAIEAEDKSSETNC